MFLTLHVAFSTRSPCFSRFYGGKFLFAADEAAPRPGVLVDSPYSATPEPSPLGTSARCFWRVFYIAEGKEWLAAALFASLIHGVALGTLGHGDAVTFYVRRYRILKAGQFWLLTFLLLTVPFPVYTVQKCHLHSV